jgi:possible pyridoxal kinase
MAVVRKEGGKKIFLCNDFPGYGKVALQGMIPTLTAMKYQLFSLPTALVSNVLDFGKAEILDTTEYMKGSVAVWRELGFSFDAMAIGFITGERQGEFLAELCREEREKGCVIFFDPIMADNGKLYYGISPEAVDSRRKLMGLSDYIVPNSTEALLLAGKNPAQLEFSLEEAKELLKALREAGAKSVCITSMKIDGQNCVFLYDEKKAEFCRIPYSQREKHFIGTGDLFSALLLGRFMQEKDFFEAGRWAVEKIGGFIDAYEEDGLSEKGIPMERYLTLLKE